MEPTPGTHEPTGWDSAARGVLQLPSGLLVRARGLRDPAPDGPEPEYGVYLLGAPPPRVAWQQRWVQWADFWVPSDPRDLAAALAAARRRARRGRVEIACWGGRGRTGTALACLAAQDGLSPAGAVAYIRAQGIPHAVESPPQRAFIARFARRARLTDSPSAPPMR
ncbi:protein-tyrosine phosphatase family protein [Nocardiopsis coralliicola]